MVGLDHVGEPTQLMFAFATSNTQLQGGDLRGLWYVGSAQPCFAFSQLTTADFADGAVGSDTLPDDAEIVFAA